MGVYTVTDENGCATDPNIFREWKYDRRKGYLTAIFDAFKFPDSNTIKFKCNIRVCFGLCQPQNCAGTNAYGLVVLGEILPQWEVALVSGHQKLQSDIKVT